LFAATTRPLRKANSIDGWSTGATIWNTGRKRGSLDDTGPIRGKDAMWAHIRFWTDSFDEFWFEPVELIDAGEDMVVAVERFGGRAKQSGVETDQTCGLVFTIRDGKIARLREYGTRAEALEAAGLRE
jgi:ketosteroid isomerase-like protein